MKLNSFEKTSVKDTVGIGEGKSTIDNFSVKGYFKAEKTFLDGHKEIVAEGFNDISNGGVDFISRQAYVNTGAGGRGAGYIGLSNQAADQTASQTTLGGEITTSGLGRSEADTITHTNGQPTTVLSHVFTATATVSNIHKAALFTAQNGGILVNFFNFASDSSLAANETLTITWTISIS